MQSFVKARLIFIGIGARATDLKMTNVNTSLNVNGYIIMFTHMSILENTGVNYAMHALIYWVNDL